MGFEPMEYNEFGRHMNAKFISKKDRKRMYEHPIILYTPRIKKDDVPRLTQIVNVYEHTSIDLEFNMMRMIKCLRQNIGSDDRAFYTLGQHILFRVVPDQEPMSLPLIQFCINYTLMMARVLLGGSMDSWKPWIPTHFSNSAIMKAYDDIIYDCREFNNHRAVCDVLAECKYWLNMLCNEIGDHLGYSISNNEFTEVAKRDEEARKSISCTFDIPKKCSPKVLEDIRTKRTRQLLDAMSKQDDLCISTYARTGLFNAGQLSEFAVHIGYKPDLIGNTISMTAPTNILMGINDPRAHVVDARGGRKAEVLKKNVSDAGQFERSVSIMMSTIKHVDLRPENFCDSKHYRKKIIHSREDLNNLDGRVATFDPKSNKGFVIDPRDDEFELIGKTVYLKTPITCMHKDRSKGVICAACYGLLLASINQDIHPGRLSGLNDADEMEQKLLSAKHALKTDTSDVNFSDNFNSYFALNVGQISFNRDFVEMVRVNPNNYKNLYLEFNPTTVRKMQDGEGRHFDRLIDEIVIYDAATDNREIIQETNNIKLFMTPDLSEYYVPASLKSTYLVHIPIVDIFDMELDLFEYEYKNSELADPLKEINSILNNGTAKTGVNKYSTYDECMDDLLPKFEAGGIHVPDIHIEMMIACMVFTEDDDLVDWTLDNPEYKFCSIDRSIKNGKSVATSLLYSDTNAQLDGKYRTYEKTGTSSYDSFIAGV